MPVAELARALGPHGFGTYAVEWTPDGPRLERVERHSPRLLIPGLVDTHFHGAYGMDFMSMRPQDWPQLGEKLRGLGYEHVLMTTVSAGPEQVLRTIQGLPVQTPFGGFHLEGPFISPEFAGAQPGESICVPPAVGSDWDPVLDHPALRLVTLAPEIPNALPLIRRLRSRGVRVNMGHSNATHAEARFGFEFGAHGVTHMFNAMRGFHHREPGLAGYALQNDELFVELIYDRVHVSREAAALLLKVKPTDKVVAVSDSTLATGVPSGTRIEMWGEQCQVHRGQVRRCGDERLAGSAASLLDVFRALCSDFGPETAIRACCINPRDALGLAQPPQLYVELDAQLQITRLHQLGAVE